MQLKAIRNDNTVKLYNKYFYLAYDTVTDSIINLVSCIKCSQNDYVTIGIDKHSCRILQLVNVKKRIRIN